MRLASSSSSSASTPPSRLVSEAQLEGAGLSGAALFSGSGIAFRRVEALRGARAVLGLVVGVAAVERALLPEVEAGQWLCFERLDDGAVQVRVDLEATLEGESRLARLYAQLSGRPS